MIEGEELLQVSSKFLLFGRTPLELPPAVPQMGIRRLPEQLSVKISSDVGVAALADLRMCAVLPDAGHRPT